MASPDPGKLVFGEPAGGFSDYDGLVEALMRGLGFIFQVRSIPESGLSHDAFVKLVCGPELALRAAGPWHFNLFAMQGIVTMPSYHTVMAVIFTYAFRGTGLIGYGIATLNLVMLVSIPPIGGHYLFDMLAGGRWRSERSPSSGRRGRE
jgi:hypothetical protein